MKRTCVTLLTLAMLMAAHQAAASGRRCDIRTIAGTYAGITHGSLFVGTPDLRTFDPATVPNPASAPPFMPAAQVGLFTIAADGSVGAEVWSGFGMMWWKDLSFTGQVTVNPDCTGELTYAPFGGDAHNVERLVIMDNGHRIQGISQQTPLGPPMAFVAEYHRLGPREAHGNLCGRAMGAGSWVLSCTGITQTESPAGGLVSLSSAMLAEFRVDRKGELAGTAMHKVGPGFIDQEISGTLNVNKDCTVDGSLDLRPALPFVISAKGLLYAFGTQGALVPMTAVVETPAGPVEAPMPARVCRLERR